MKKSELRQIIREEIQNLVSKLHEGWMTKTKATDKNGILWALEQNYGNKYHSEFYMQKLDSHNNAIGEPIQLPASDYPTAYNQFYQKLGVQPRRGVEK
jgi:hypothetical protein